MSRNSSETSSFNDESWIQWFCNLTGNHFFCEIDKGFIEDSFNLFGLKQYLPKDYSKALDIILDKIGNYRMLDYNWITFFYCYNKM
jgi:casein kinase II subunit beta